MKPGGSRLTAAVLAIACAPLVGAQEPAQKPLSAGEIVLLANKDRADTQAADAVRHALTNPDPLVRRAAARVASVSQPAVYDALLHALADEKDPVVAVEFITDALALAGAEALPRVEPVALGLNANGIVPVAEWFARMRPDGFLERLDGWSRVPGIEARLTNAVLLAASRHPELRERIFAAWKPLASEKSWKVISDPGTNTHVTMRTPPGLAGRVMASTLSAAGCTPKKGMVGNALVTYAPGGRPIRIEVNVAHLPQPCQNALTAIARIGLDEYDSGGQAQTVIVPLTPDFIACAADPESNAAIGSGPGTPVKDPILKKEVKPDYTGGAMRRKVEGREELDAVLSRSGCIRFAKVTHTLDPELDAQGIMAVIQWKFQPGMLDGTPVAVLISVELTFTLRR